MAPSVLDRIRRSTGRMQKSKDASRTTDNVSTATAASAVAQATPQQGGAKPPATNPSSLWPPPTLLLPAQVLSILNAIQDYQFTHGSLIKHPTYDSLYRQSRELPYAFPIGISLFPTPYPRWLYERATRVLRPQFDELYAKVSCDEAWLRQATVALARVDPLAACLWSCVDAARRAREERQRVSRAGGEDAEAQRIPEQFGLGIWRSDYMLQRERHREDGEDGVVLKQVEFNTISCAGGIHSNRATNVHRHLALSGAYNVDGADSASERDETTSAITIDRLSVNETLAGITKALASAHAFYLSHIARRSPRASDMSAIPQAALTQHSCCVLMLVQPRNINIADERPIEYSLWNSTPAVPCFRVEFGTQTLSCTKVGPAGELLFSPPAAGSRTWEVSIVYFRAGHDEDEYFNGNRVISQESIGAQVRVRLESSRAIMCPTLLGHIATFKMVQQALTAPGAVERFLSPDKAESIRSTFTDIYWTGQSRAARVVASDEVQDWILKPSLEGGGHGVFGKDIPGYFHSLKQMDKGKYVLMRKIETPPLRNRLMSPRGMYEGGVISELGVFGACLWRKGSGSDCEMITSEPAGCSLKTKPETFNEMSVVKGYGCFDSPLLLDSEAFWRLSKSADSLTLVLLNSSWGMDDK